MFVNGVEQGAAVDSKVDDDDASALADVNERVQRLPAVICESSHANGDNKEYDRGRCNYACGDDGPIYATRNLNIYHSFVCAHRFQIVVDCGNIFAEIKKVISW